RDFFAQHRDLGLEEVVLALACHDVVDQHLGAVVLHEGFPIEVIFDFAVEGGVKDLFLDLRVDFQLVANLLRDLPLAVLAAGILELLEQVLDFAMVVLEQSDRVGKLLFGHDMCLLDGALTKPLPTQVATPAEVPCFTFRNSCLTASCAPRRSTRYSPKPKAWKASARS